MLTKHCRTVTLLYQIDDNRDSSWAGYSVVDKVKETDSGQARDAAMRFTLLLLPALLLLLSPVTPAVTGRPDLVCSLCRTVMELLDQAITDTTNEQAVAEFLAQVGHFV